MCSNAKEKQLNCYYDGPAKPLDESARVSKLGYTIVVTRKKDKKKLLGYIFDIKILKGRKVDEGIK